jgi:hypothetical protein
LDRRLPYTQMLPADIDLAQPQQFAMISDGFLIESVMGQSPWCYGLACTPTTPASMSVTVGRGALGQMSVVDLTNPGTAAIADTTDALMKVGINLSGTTLTFVAPTTSGQSQAFLIEGQAQEADAGAQVLQYYNSANPSQPFAGPNNTGAPNNTLRTQRAVLQVVAGAPAATGSQVTPGVTSGWVPLYVVTLANGATTVVAGNIVQHSAAPFSPFSLPNLTPGFSRLLSFRSSTTWTAPAGVTRVRVRVWGAAGGSGGGSGAASVGGGGSGGGYSESVFAVVPGTAYTITIGAAGAGGGIGLSGSAGGTTSFASFISATGGTPGLGAAAGVIAGAGTPVAGVGVGGILNLSGQLGGTGVATSSGSFISGIGGSSGAGTGVGAAYVSSNSSTAQNGIAGQFPGGGASGGISGGGGAPGGAGLCLLEF